MLGILVTMDAKQGLEMVRLVRPRTSRFRFITTITMCSSPPCPISNGRSRRRDCTIGSGT